MFVLKTSFFSIMFILKFIFISYISKHNIKKCKSGLIGNKELFDHKINYKQLRSGIFKTSRKLGKNT